MIRNSIMFNAVLRFFLLFHGTEAKPAETSAGQEPFQINEFLQGTFGTRGLNGSWLTEDSLLYTDSALNLSLFNARNQSSSLFLNGTVLSDFRGATPIVSRDLLYVLIRYNVSAVFRHSTTAQFAIYDIANEQYYHIADKNHTQIAQWAPVGHGLVYVYLNNIYYLEHPSSDPVAITTNGEPGIVYNGVPDWVYEEEVLGSGSALWFAPDGKHLAFATFNDTLVDTFEYFKYGNPGELDSQYPEVIDIKYPKVGRKNPDVQTFIVNLETGEDTRVPSEIKAIPESSLQEDDYVLYDIAWVSESEFAVIYSNRVQNQAQLVRCTSDTTCTPEASYQSDNGWLEIHIPNYNKAATQRLEILPQPEGDDFFDHLVLTDVESGTARRLTQGKFYVLSIFGWDEPNNLIYYAASVVDAPSQRQVYVINLDSNVTNCLTCQMNTSQGVCKYASAAFSRDFSYVAKVCQGPGPYLVEIQNTNDETDTYVWENNERLINLLSEKALPVVKNLRVPVDGGFEANVRLLLPPGLDETSTTKYPAVVNVYGGPNSNQINDAYSSGFQNYIVTNRQYIYIYIDGRGSGRDGQNKMFQIYRRFATVEIQDQIAVTRYLQQQFPYIDADNTGIWGWSYGGFATGWTIVQDTQNVFKFGLSVAPVTSFIYYDSIYTERYMGLPTSEDNLLGYNNTDLSRRVLFFANKTFFLIHGNADDNVHYQQSMLLSRALELADIPFRQQSYPDENHSLGGVSAHLYHTIDRFWARSFGLPDPPAPRLAPPETNDV